MKNEKEQDKNNRAFVAFNAKQVTELQKRALKEGQKQKRPITVAEYVRIVLFGCKDVSHNTKNS